MSITKRQFDLLKAMDITVWQRRELSTLAQQSEQSGIASIAPTQQAIENNTKAQAMATEEALQPSPNKSINLDLTELLNQQLFNDVLLCIGASRADLSVQSDQVDLGLINWQFTDNEQIEFGHNCLKTPNLKTLAKSAQLKKALWQSIGPLSSS